MGAAAKQHPALRSGSRHRTSDNGYRESTAVHWRPVEDRPWSTRRFLACRRTLAVGHRMRTVTVSVSADGRLVAKARVASSIWSRFWGLMWQRSLPSGEALIIDPCSSVHTLFMPRPIDVALVDTVSRVLTLDETFKPNHAHKERGSS